MNRFTPSRVRALIVGVTIAGLAMSAAPIAAVAAPPGARGAVHPQIETLDRGLVAVKTSAGVFLTWRLQIGEATGASATGLTGTDFVVYRDGAAIATITDSTNFLDPTGTTASKYRVAAVFGAVEGEPSAEATALPQNYIDVPLNVPEGGTTPAGENYTYAATDTSVGDVDGDGQYEYIVKWDPSNSKDVSQVGYTGPVYIDTYKLDGTLLNRLDLGVNIRAGAHYTQFLVYDFDGDGRSETMLKTAPGTKSIRYAADGSVASESYVTLLPEDIAAGYANADDYRMSATDYADHLVEVFRGWSAREEVVSGEWPATLEQAFGIPVTHSYPLSAASARELVDYFIDVYAPSRSANNRLRNFAGFIIDGPEYLTVFDSATGEELATERYLPGRTDDGLLWGDYALPRIEPGNRVDRFLSGVAYLDGEHPSAIFARGYYTRTTIATYDWDGEELAQRWAVDSGWVPMTNPFNDTPHGRSGTDAEYGSITTQGFHSLSAADVDADGKQEVIYGSATLDDDGSVLYSSFDTLPAGSAAPGTSARLGHGDAMHVTDIDPHRPGLEIFTVHEGGTTAPYGYALRDAATGAVIYGEYTGRDTGRGMIGDIDPNVPGYETWATRLRAASGAPVSGSLPGTNQSIRWSADMRTQLVNGSGSSTPTIDDRVSGRMLTATGTRTNNSTKGNPSLVADVLGDWREELVVRTTDSSALRIYVSTDLTTHKMYTLMHDPQYRVEVARQQTTYNQPSYTSFYFASDMDFADVPLRPADRTAPTITVKQESKGRDGVYSDVSFKLFDEEKVDRLALNGVEKDLTDNAWSDLNGVKPGAFGGVAGSNELKVYDVAGNVATLSFILDVTAPTVTVKDAVAETIGTAAAGYELVSFKLFDEYKVDRLTLNGVGKDLTDSVWSDLNGVTPGAFGAKLGANELKVFDVAGNATTVAFTLVAPVPAWVATKVYNQGDKVAYNGAIYVAQWWTQNETPGSTATGSWMQQGALVAAAGTEVRGWTASWVYSGGETVAHNGHTWKAKWWTRNQAPGDPNGPWQDLGTY